MGPQKPEMVVKPETLEIPHGEVTVSWAAEWKEEPLAQHRRVTRVRALPVG